MFITSNRSQTGYSGTSQRAGGKFLIVFSGPKLESTGFKELRVFVKSVRMSQMGHFMMGRVSIDGHDFTLSGTYGSDGLPKGEAWDQDWIFGSGRHDDGTYQPGSYSPLREVWPGFWDKLHPVPEELQKAFWNGGGHNSSGSEGPAIHKWASENIATLTKLRKPTNG